MLTLIDQGLVSGGNALIQLLLLRVFGLEEYGVLSFIMLFILGLVALNQTIIIMPFQVLYHKNIYKDGGATIDKLQNYVLLLYVPLFFVVVASNYFLEFLNFPELLAGGVYGFGYLYHDFLRKKLYVVEQYTKVVLVDGFVVFFSLVTIGFGYWRSWNMTQVLFINGAILFVITYLSLDKGRKTSLSKEVYLEHWQFSKWLIASTVLQWFSGNIVISTAGVILGSWVVGVLRIGQTINGLIGVMFQLMESYFPSQVAKIFNQDGLPALKKYLFHIGWKSFTLTAVVGILIIVFKDMVIPPVFGEEMREYTYIMYWFAGLLLVNVLNIILRFYIRTVNQNQLIFEAYILMSVFGFLTSKYLVENWSLTGVCFGLLITQILALGWYALRLNVKKLGVISF